MPAKTLREFMEDMENGGLEQAQKGMFAEAEQEMSCLSDVECEQLEKDIMEGKVKLSFIK